MRHNNSDDNDDTHRVWKLLTSVEHPLPKFGSGDHKWQLPALSKALKLTPFPQLKYIQRKSIYKTLPFPAMHVAHSVKKRVLHLPGIAASCSSVKGIAKQNTRQMPTHTNSKPKNSQNPLFPSLAETAAHTKNVKKLCLSLSLSNNIKRKSNNSVFHTPAQSFRTRHREREEHTLQQTSKLVPQLLVQNSFLKKKTKNNRKGGPKTSTGQTDYRAAKIAINQKKWSQRVQQSSLDVFLLTCTNQLQTERTLVLLKQSSKQEQKQL